MDMQFSKSQLPKPARNRPVAWMLGVAALCLAGSLAGAMHASAAPAQPALGAQDPAEDAFWKVCGDCHDPDRIRETRRTRGGWEDIIFQMIDKGAVGTDHDFELTVQYLLAHYGMVNVNQSEAPDIALVTGLSPKEADAIVAFRKEKGNFKNFDELAKVPGVDAQKLEAHRPAILF